MKFIAVILFIGISAVYPQKLEFISELGDFSSSSSFDIDLNENIYVTDIDENTVIKLDPDGNELYSIGGYGWTESSFDHPSDVVTNTLTVYISDKNNNRIQRFDKDLNFLSAFSGDENDSDISFGYPTCIELSKMGDLFILDTDNNRILKFSLTGEYQLEIGSNDAGVFALSNPIYFSVDAESNIYVLDQKIIKVFDQYGNGQFQFNIPFSPIKTRIDGNSILYIEDACITLYDLKDRKITHSFEEFENMKDETIVDAKILKDKLYILTSHNILKYRIFKK